jgi:hypothetical protein
LEEEWGIALIRLFHFADVVQVIPADAVDASHRKKITRVQDRKRMNAWGNDETAGHCILQLYTLISLSDHIVYTHAPSIAICTQTVMRTRFVALWLRVQGI